MKGAVWTVDEVEYQKRRSQKITGYVCDSFVILYPASTGKWMLEGGGGVRTASAEGILPFLAVSCLLNLAYMHKSLSDQ